MNTKIPEPVGRDKLEPIDNEVVFSENQKKLVEIISKIHNNCKGKKGNAFEKTYTEVVLLMKNKATPLWYEGVANQLVDILEDCNEDFFDCFNKPKEGEEISNFEDYKKRILESHWYIQSIKHKRREDIRKIFRGEYFTKTDMDIEITNTNYDQLFKNHEELLIGFFEKYHLKI